MARPYVPDAGDIVWISFSPQAGHEPAGHRPAVGLSPAAYNAKTSLMVCCPMTTHIKRYPFEVVVAGESPSAVLADQVKKASIGVSGGPNAKGQYRRPSWRKYARKFGP